MTKNKRRERIEKKSLSKGEEPPPATLTEALNHKERRDLWHEAVDREFGGLANQGLSMGSQEQSS